LKQQGILKQQRANAPDWLVARPIAHRGLHDKSQGRIENSIAAAEAAIAQNYAIECDVQLSQDGEAIVFHDFTLDRLATAQGRVDAMTAAELQKVGYKDGTGTLPTLASFLSTLAGRTPLIVEIKSRFDGDPSLAQSAAALAAAYNGPVAIKSFDPDVLRVLRSASATCPIGIISEAHFDHEEWAYLSSAAKAALTDFSFYSEIQPDFLSWCAQDLPHAVPRLCREGIGMPVMAWTLRSPQECARIAAWTDQIIFEGFAP
jgi:glycerophosphoryl diester phosphodiesterase